MDGFHNYIRDMIIYKMSHHVGHPRYLYIYAN